MSLPDISLSTHHAYHELTCRMGNALTLARSDLLKELEGIEDDIVPDLPSSRA